jgi:serine/threonine-protein kinase
MSPEQASGRADVDTRSDLYSMGALAFTLFTGRPPFLGRNASAILRQHLTQEPPRLRDQGPELPAALSRLKIASQNAATRLAAAQSSRASLLGSLRRLHGAARRLAAANADAAVPADFDAACRLAVSEGATAVATGADTKAGP